MSVNLDTLVNYTNNLLRLHDYPDYGPMGLQFKGKSEVRVIGSTVSLSCDIIERANSLGVDALLAHHGLFWNNEPRDLEERRGRLDLLHKYQISVLGYHLCLDRDSKFGNNILAARKLGLGSLTPWQDVGYSGTYKKEMDPNNFFQRAWEKFSDYNPPIPEAVDFQTFGGPIKKVAVITGGAPQYIVQAHADGFDTFVTGEVAEPSVYLAEDLGMNFLALGHYRTETLGVRNLSRHLSQHFGLQHQFIPGK